MRNTKNTLWLRQRLLLLLMLSMLLLGGLDLTSYAQQSGGGNYPAGGGVRVKEVDGAPNVPGTQTLVFPNGSLTRAGQTVTVTFPAAGGSPAGSGSELQYRVSAATFGAVTGSSVSSGNILLAGTLTFTSTTAASNLITQGAAINIGATSTDGIILQNTTAAAAGAQQWSPRLHFSGQGWKTDATAASQAVDWIVEAVPVQGAANPTTNLVLSSQINGGGYTPFLVVGSNGLVSGGTTSSQSGWRMNGSGLFAIGGDNSTAARVESGNSFYISGKNIADTNGYHLVSGGILTWTNSTNDPTATADTGFVRAAAAVIRTTNGSTGAGSLVLGTSTVGSIGTSGVGVLAIANGTTPTSSPADEFQLYSADSAAGDANAFARNEAGEINRLTGLGSRNSSSFAKTSDTTLANITGLTRNVEAGRTYAFRAVIQTTAAVTGGVKFAISGTATATAISYEGRLESSAAFIAQTRATGIDTVVCASTTTTAGTCRIDGVIQVSTAGTLTVQFAQNASDGSASTVLANQLFYLIPIN